MLPSSLEDGEVRGVLRELLGLGEPPAAVETQRLGEERGADGVTVAHLEFPNLLGEVVPAVLCLPDEAAPRPLAGVVCLPGTSSTAEELAAPECGRQEEGRGRLVGWARELARQGMATLSLTLCGCTARRGTAEDWATRVKLLAPYGRSLVGVMADEALRGAAVLAAAEGVDPGRLGTAGFSLGGQMAWLSLALAPHLKAGAPLCGGLGSLDRAIREGDPHRHGPHFYVPHLLRSFDHGRIVAACIAPRPLYVLAPLRDEDMPASGVDELIREVVPAYEAAGRAEAVTFVRPDDSHVFREEYFAGAAAWLRRALG